MKTAEHVMRPADAVIQVDQPIREALARFETWDCPYLMVVDGDRVKGVIHRDHVSRTVAEKADEHETVGDLPSLKLVTCTGDATVDEMQRLFEKSHISLVLVIDEDRQVCGIVAPEDIWPQPMARFRAILETAPMMGTAMPHDNAEPYTMKPHIERKPPGSTPLVDAE